MCIIAPSLIEGKRLRVARSRTVARTLSVPLSFSPKRWWGPSQALGALQRKGVPIRELKKEGKGQTNTPSERQRHMYINDHFHVCVFMYIYVMPGVYAHPLVPASPPPLPLQSYLYPADIFIYSFLILVACWSPNASGNV